MLLRACDPGLTGPGHWSNNDVRSGRGWESRDSTCITWDR